MLMDAHDAAINHQILKVRVIDQHLKNAKPMAFMSPAVIAYVDTMPMAETFRQIAPGGASPAKPANFFERQLM